MIASCPRTALLRRVVLAALAIGATAFTASFPAAAPTEPAARTAAPGADRSRIRNYISLHQRAQRENRKLRLIARLSPAAIQSGTAFAPAASAYPAAVRAAHARVLARMHAYGRVQATAIDNLPLLVLEADANEMEALVATGEVDAVFEDVPVPASLVDSVPLIGAGLAQERNARGAGTTVAILDTGVESTHPLLAGRVVDESCFSSTSAAFGATSVCPGGASSSTEPGSAAPCDAPSCDHGTHVAGIAAGRGTGSMAFNGVAPDANIMAVQVFSRFTDSATVTTCASVGRASPCTLTFTSDQMRGLQRVIERQAALNVVAVNMSLGGGNNATACDGDARKPLVDALLAANVATVISSGNDSLSGGVGAPACISSAIATGSTTKADGLSSFSNSAGLVDILAPGSAITSSVTGGAAGVKSGTSMASPHVTGAFAAVRSVVPQATVAEILAALQNAGTPVTDPRNQITRQRLNVAGALDLITTTRFAVAPGMLFELRTGGDILAHTSAECTSGGTGSTCNGWIRLDNNSRTRAIAAGGANLYQLHNNGRIWRYTGTRCQGESCPGWQLLDRNASTGAIAAGGDQLYQLQKTGVIARYTGTPCAGTSCRGWVRLDLNPLAIAIVADGPALYQLRSNGEVLRHTGVACTGTSCPGWERLENNPATVSLAASGGQLYQRRSDGSVLRFTGAICTGDTCSGWVLLDNDPRTVEIAAGPSIQFPLFQRRDDGSVLRHTGVPCAESTCPGWTLVDNAAATQQIVASSRGLFQRRSSPEVLRWVGTDCATDSCLNFSPLDNATDVGTLMAGQP